MGVAFCRHAVGGPAGVGNTQLAFNIGLIQHPLQRRHLADGADTLQISLHIANGDTGGVVAAILEPFQAIEQIESDVPAGDSPYDSAHGLFLYPVLFSLSFSPAAASPSGSSVWRG
jgi:hypothetical protein